ncbi:MAG TPA: 4Fe-4S dicluster-binding protein, partial [Lacunisphaera sp.]
MLQACAADPDVNLPISGIGGITTWRDAAEFVALGATSLQVCTAVMHYGFRIVEDMTDGLNAYLDSKGMKSLADLRGKAVRSLDKWENLDLKFQRVARIDYDKCIGCNLCYIACEDGAHQCIDLKRPEELKIGLGPGRVPHKPVPKVREEDCVGCNLCSLVCPVDDCITMNVVSNGHAPMSWSNYQAKLAKGEMQPIPPHP